MKPVTIMALVVLLGASLFAQVPYRRIAATEIQKNTTDSTTLATSSITPTVWAPSKSVSIHTLS